MWSNLSQYCLNILLKKIDWVSLEKEKENQGKLKDISIF